MARRPIEVSPFEPGQSIARADPAQVNAPCAMPAAAAPLPGALMLTEPIGWSENGVLCMFHEEQLVTHSHDIERLISRGAKYLVLQ